MDIEDKEENDLEEQEMEVYPCTYNPGGDPRDVLKDWKAKMAAGTLKTSDFKELWRKYVPHYYTLHPGCDWNIEEKAEGVLIDIIEAFVADGDFAEEVRKLREEDKPPSVCGRVFKTGEPTYSCRECGMDATCVLCVTCFKQSTHRLHNYKMSTSQGGGCCDCGDVEAWKVEPHCAYHFKGFSVRDAWPSAMSREMAARCRIAFNAILRFAYQVLTLQHSPRLPRDLRPIETEVGVDTEENLFCTVLYNDEIHTFEQVINVLSKIVKCSQKDAMEFVTGIDREGRAVVRCGMLIQCQELKTDIERFTTRHGGQPLKVQVVHTHVIAHQVFALHLLKWLQQTVSLSESFRTLFTEVALKQEPPEPSIVEGMLLRDSILWKSARSHWHRLFISGMLMEYQSKMAFARVFTKNYGTVIKDFIRDDHEHSFSIASLSVQIFTVPTLTYYLISHEEVLFIMLNTFLSECTPKLNKDNKLLFERNSATQQFKRAQCILYDLRYILGNVPTPEQWDDDLRKGFLRGLSLFMRLMTFMEGMDAATRQVVQHMEFEPEWESAFNLHIKLSHALTLLGEWCGSDKVVLIKAFRMCMKELSELNKNTVWDVRELGDHSATCIKYDVSTQPVSIHLPLSRFFTALFLHLEKYGLSFDSHELAAMNRPTPVQIMEPVLRTHVMIGQVHAGMWRRNGYSVLNQLFFYQNVRCRTEMLDRDIVMLQIGASLIKSDEFLIHIVSKYSLLCWLTTPLDEAEDEVMRHIVLLVEEMLGLIVTIVGERWVPGVSKVTSDDKIKKDIIQQLCIKPLSHSELNKTLPDDVNHETGLERVIDDVAVFKKPENSVKGVYELKEELYDQYNMFFYHYTREELSKSEEAQRRRRKNKGLLECCPPPQLPPLTAAFESLPNLLQCDVMMIILQTILTRSIDLRCRSFSENQLQKALYLIGYALQEEQSQRYPYLRFSEKSVPWKIEKLVAELTKSPRVESMKDMLLWVLERFKKTRAEIEVIPVAPNSEKDLKEWRSKMAAEKRAKIMAQMAAMQSSFMKGNEHLLKEAEEQDKEMTELWGATYTCILCQQDTTVKANGQAMVLCVLLQRSTVHGVDKDEPDKADKVFTKPLFRTSRARPQLHTSTCGHVMHSSCWQSYFDNVLAKETRRPFRLRQPTSFDVEKQEFLCPLCECLGNSVIPLLPPIPSPSYSPTVSFNSFLDALETIVRLRVTEDEINFHVPSLDQVLGEVLEEPLLLRSLFTRTGEPPLIDQSVKDMMSYFADSVYSKGLNVDPATNPYTPILVWNTIYYTVLSTEAIIEDKPLLGSLPMRQDSCLDALISAGAWLPFVWNSRQISDQVLYIMTPLFEDAVDRPCILDVDCFGLLVSLILGLPSAFEPQFPTNDSLQRHVLLLCFYAQIWTICMSKPPDTSESMETCGDDDDLDLVQIPQSKATIHLEESTTHNIWRWRDVKKQCLPFLRRSAMFLYYLHGKEKSGKLAEYGGDTFENLCSYLSLPSTRSELLDTAAFTLMAAHWSEHPRVELYRDKFVLPTEINNLVPLPNDYSELINKVSSFSCPHSDKDVSRNPTMCLVCGVILSSHSYCCQQNLMKTLVGACTYHAHQCGAGVGIFLRIRECEVLLLASQGRGSFHTAPYVDRYGETDQGLRRGNPLTLCKELYSKLQKMWVGHMLHEEIVRAADVNSNVLATPWQNL